MMSWDNDSKTSLRNGKGEKTGLSAVPKGKYRYIDWMLYYRTNRVSGG